MNNNLKRLWHRLAPLVLLFLPGLALAQAAGGLPAFSATPGPGNSTTYTLTIQTLLTLTALSFIPATLLMMTSFTRIIIVFSLLRHALGTQTAPPTQILVGLALFLTFFIMAPVAERVYNEAYLPLSENRINIMEAADRASVPVKAFMLKQTRESDLALFARLANIDKIEKPEDTPMRVMVPAYVTSELKTAFQIGFVVFIPFLVIDMVVASLLMSMGMMMMSPVIVSLPFKIMLFVLVDGWQLLIGSLVKSFGT
ncbi:flagellar type III secretion system pore protein FliP [Azovibrio restrictus]|uniref:flagellar type III secretion system pore protein FliP n=1 Tax=Azovibrio restrictus TaxID=146938 RepID=UPI0026EFC3FA|nr:flagellar type III secretion system pore protein FliP [Azovibrio restrictus]MDD3481937.1 flagellar type III secretion system pore protein FliP [Azovibrio restrictus]